jgi:hypothetical protein
LSHKRNRVAENRRLDAPGMADETVTERLRPGVLAGAAFVLGALPGFWQDYAEKTGNTASRCPNRGLPPGLQPQPFAS